MHYALRFQKLRDLMKAYIKDNTKVESFHKAYLQLITVENQ